MSIHEADRVLADVGMPLPLLDPNKRVEAARWVRGCFDPDDPDVDRRLDRAAELAAEEQGDELAALRRLGAELGVEL